MRRLKLQMWTTFVKTRFVLTKRQYILYNIQCICRQLCSLNIHCIIYSVYVGYYVAYDYNIHGIDRSLVGTLLNCKLSLRGGPGRGGGGHGYLIDPMNTNVLVSINTSFIFLGEPRPVGVQQSLEDADGWGKKDDNEKMNFKKTTDQIFTKFGRDAHRNITKLFFWWGVSPGRPNTLQTIKTYCIWISIHFIKMHVNRKI